jgi:putative CocE/NonD family hydrolase
MSYHPAHIGHATSPAIRSGTPDRAPGCYLLGEQEQTMRDGVVLRADVSLPIGIDRAPAVLVRLPYGKREAAMGMAELARWLGTKGYACVVQDVRGKFASDGVFEPMRNEVADGVDSVAWVAAQPWCDSRVGMWGESYYGYTSLAAAVGGHPALRCIAPGDIATDRWHCVFRQGAFQLNCLAFWALSMDDAGYVDASVLDVWHLPLVDMPATIGLEGAYFRALVDHVHDAAWWAERSLIARLDEITVPVLSWTGWYDVYSGPQLAEFPLLRRRSVGGEQTHLLVGPWDHESSAEHADRAICVPVPPTAEHRWDAYQAFFDHYLMGLANGYGDAGPVEIFTVGGGWRHLADWPPTEAVPTPWYARAGGLLSPEPPRGDERPDRYRYDPADPVAETVGLNCWALAGELADRRELERRADILSYTSEPFAADLELTGPLLATLYASTSAPDTDFTVTLVDVFPDGTASQIQAGIVRASLRHGPFRPEPVEPGAVEPYAIDLYPTSYRVPAGHRLRLDVSSSCFDRWDRNPNTGAPFGYEATPVVAEQAIHHSAAHPSRIDLPIMPAR